MKNGFAVSGILYPMLILFLCFILLILGNLAETHYHLRKTTHDIMMEINGEDSKGRLKNDLTHLLNQLSYNGSCVTNYQVKNGVTLPYFDTSINMDDWNGRFYTREDGSKAVLIDNGEVCGYKLEGQTNLQMMKSGECEVALLTNQAESGLLCPIVSITNEEIIALKEKVDHISEVVYPVGSIYMSEEKQDPNTLFGGTWEERKVSLPEIIELSKDSAMWESGDYHMTTGEKEADSARIRYNEFIPVEPGKTYTLSFHKTTNAKFVLRSYDQNKKFVYSIGSVSNNATFVAPSTAYYVTIALYDLSYNYTQWLNFVQNTVGEITAEYSNYVYKYTRIS